jgi:hypothetical protein
MNVASADLIVGEGRRNRHRAIKIIGVRRPQGGDGEPSLREASCILGMSMDHGANTNEFAVEQRVGIQVGRWSQVPFDYTTGEIDHYHMLRPEAIVVHALGLDDQQSLLAVYSRCIAEGVQHKTTLHEFQIRLEHFFPKLSKQHDRSFCFRRIR